MDREVGLDQAVGVAGTGFVEKLEIGIGQSKQVAKFSGKLSTTLAVAVVDSFVDAAGVVENGEQLADFDLGTRGFRQSQAVFKDSRPMADAMGAVPTERVVFEDRVDEGFEDHLFCWSATASPNYRKRNKMTRIMKVGRNMPTNP